MLFNCDLQENAVKSEDVPLAILERRLKLAKSKKEKSELQTRLNELIRVIENELEKRASVSDY
ncbi:hypothetical protein CHS0354_033107, partial [Potamilus streckersoni]